MGNGNTTEEKAQAAQEAIKKAQGAASNMAKAALKSDPNQEATVAAVDELSKSAEIFSTKNKGVTSASVEPDQDSKPTLSFFSRIGSSITAFGSYISSSFSALSSYVGSFFTEKESKAQAAVNNTNSMESANIAKGQEQNAQAAELKNRLANKNKQNTQEDKTSTTSKETYKPSWRDVLTGKAQEKVKEHGQNALEYGIKAQNKTEEASHAAREAQRNNTRQQNTLSGRTQQ